MSNARDVCIVVASSMFGFFVPVVLAALYRIAKALEVIADALRGKP